MGLFATRLGRLFALAGVPPQFAALQKYGILLLLSCDITGGWQWV